MSPGGAGVSGTPGSRARGRGPCTMAAEMRGLQGGSPTPPRVPLGSALEHGRGGLLVAPLIPQKWRRGAGRSPAPGSGVHRSLFRVPARAGRTSEVWGAQWLAGQVCYLSKPCSWRSSQTAWAAPWASSLPLGFTHARGRQEPRGLCSSPSASPSLKGVIPSSLVPWVPVWRGHLILQALVWIWGHGKVRLRAWGQAPHGTAPCGGPVCRLQE